MIKLIFYLYSLFPAKLEFIDILIVCIYKKKKNQNLGAIIFGSDQEVREVMRAVRRNNATGVFSWIGSDGWSARNLVSDGNEPEVIYLN